MNVIYKKKMYIKKYYIDKFCIFFKFLREFNENICRFFREFQHHIILDVLGEYINSVFNY